MGFKVRAWYADDRHHYLSSTAYKTVEAARARAEKKLGPIEWRQPLMGVTPDGTEVEIEPEGPEDMKQMRKEARQNDQT